MTTALRDHARVRAMSRSTLWRILDEADLKPHRSVYWLNSHDPAFEAKARDICHLYVNALRCYQHGRLVICVDEKTGMQILQRKHPTQLVQPGKPEKREQEYIRHGVRVLIASFVVPTGQGLWHLGPTRTSEDFAAHLANVRRQLPAMQHYDWVVDNLNTHWSLELCRLVAAWCEVRRIGMCCILRPNTGRGSIRWNGGLGCWPAVFSSAGTFVRSTTLRRSCWIILTCTTPIMRIRTGGPIPGNHWSEPRPSVKLGVNSGRDGHGLAPAPTVLNVLCTPLDRISGLRLNW
jgi:hypothetical protein